MKNLAALFLVILCPAFAFCEKSDSTFTLKIITTLISKDTKLYLAYQKNGQKIIDSAEQEPITGTYVFSGEVTIPISATLVADPDRLRLSGLMTKARTGEVFDHLKFYLYPGQITLETSDLISKGKFRESIINSDYKKLELLRKPINDKQIAISAQLRITTDKNVSHKLGLQLDTLEEAIKPILKEFIIENPNSYIALLALEEYGGSFPDLAVIEPMFKKLSPIVRKTTTGVEYYKFLLDKKNLKIGTLAPDFEQNDVAGNPVSLSSFKGKYVLLDFWASWCGPCRQANPTLRQIYQDFKNLNFTILGISLDAADGKALWLQAIKKDQLNWTQVSDLKQWDNQVAKLYSVRAIPETFLIDPNGIIIAKGLNHEELRKKLQAVLPAQ